MVEKAVVGLQSPTSSPAKSLQSPSSSPANIGFSVPKKRTTSHITNAEGILPRELDPMYQGMKRDDVIAKRMLFANYRAEVTLQKSLDTYNNICREQVMHIRHAQRRLYWKLIENKKRKDSIKSEKRAVRCRTANIPYVGLNRKYYTPSTKRQPLTNSSITLPVPRKLYGDEDDIIIASVDDVNKTSKKRPRPLTAPFFITDSERIPNITPSSPKSKMRPRPKTAMELIKSAQPLGGDIEKEEIDEKRLRTSSYYRRLTSLKLKGVVSNELAVFFRQMKIKI